MAKNKKKNETSVFWRIIISAVGVMLILIAVSNFLLFFIGDSTSAKISTRRVGGADSGRPADQRYEWSVDYTFTTKNGEVYSGHTIKRGGDMSVNVGSQIYYFPFAPFISALEKEAEPNPAQLLYIVIGVFLITVMNKKKKRKFHQHKAVKKSNGEIDVPALEDYDDSVEEVYHDT